jgi:hypothetical protein
MNNQRKDNDYLDDFFASNRLVLNNHLENISSLTDKIIQQLEGKKK